VYVGDYIPFTISDWGSLIESEDPSAIPFGKAVEARNCQFSRRGVRCRDGINETIKTVNQDQAVTGMGVLVYNGGTSAELPIAFDYGGRLELEGPVGAGATAAITSSIVPLPASAFMQHAHAFNKMFMAFGDMQTGLARPALYDGATRTLNPVAGRVFGEAWKAEEQYYIGECITNSTANGKIYRCTQAGVSDVAEPAFNAADPEHTNYVDGGVVWQENTPEAHDILPVAATAVLARVAAVGTLAAARDFYVRLTLVSGSGETEIASVAAATIINTVLNDRIVVTGPTLASLRLWVQALVAPFVPTGYNVYVADVATGAAAPAVGAYKKSNVGAVALGANHNIDAAAVGAVGPVTNTAYVTTAGNICAGKRYWILMQKTRTAYYTGVTEMAVFSFTATGGRKILFTGLPLGPENTIARALALTVVGKTIAGQYWQIDSQDTVEGVVMTSTVVSDNVSTTATVDFTDDYLPSTREQTEAFRRERFPAVSDVYFDPTMACMIYTGAVGFESSHLISKINDAETWIEDVATVLVHEQNGERTVTWREFNGQHFSFKEHSVFLVTPGEADPEDWIVTLAWKNAGAVGPRAVDVGVQFMAFAHSTGIWVSFGGMPVCISSPDLDRTWGLVNWSQGHKIWVRVDDDASEIHVGVPLDNSVECNKRITINFASSFDQPLKDDRKKAQRLEARKVSVDDIYATMEIKVTRTLAAARTPEPELPDQRTATEQVLLPSSNPDGVINMVVPDSLADNTQGIDQVYETGTATGAGEDMHAAAVRVKATGLGNLFITLKKLTDQIGGPPNGGGKEIREIPLTETSRDISRSASGMSGGFRLRFSNGKQPNAGFDLQRATLFVKPFLQGRQS
jgi:hypothetical protein